MLADTFESDAPVPNRTVP